MTTIQGFTPPPNHATMGVESTILDNLTPAPSDMSGQGEPDMSAKLKQRAVINGKIFWLTGSTQQELFQSYLSHAITEGVVVPPDENGQHRKDGLSTRFSDIAERWFTLYKVGKVRETTLTGYESYLKRHVLPYFGEMDVRDISIDDVQLFLNSKESLSKKTIDEIWLVVRMVLGKCPQAADPSLTVCGTACDCAKPPKTQSVQGLNDCYFIEDVTKKVPKSQNFGTLT